MGNQLFDQYSLLHFASGVGAYFVGVPPVNWLFVHITFEIVENSHAGMRFINENLTFWPGGKPRADSGLNMVGDNISAMVGWWAASKLDALGKERDWYNQ